MGVGQKIGTAILELVTDNTKLKAGIDDAVKKITSINLTNARKTLSSFHKEHQASFTAMGQGLGIVVAGAAAVTAGIIALGQRGAAVADVRDAFDSLSASAGGSEAMLAKLRAGVNGTMSDFDLMKMANSAMSNGLLKSADDAGVLAKGAKMLADRVGGDTAESFDKLMSSIQSGRTSQLKQMGLFVDTKVAVDKYATAHKILEADMTDAQRAQAIAAATVDELRKQTDAAGASTKDFGDWIDWGKAKVSNFVDGLGVAIATSPVVQAGMEAIGASLGTAFGDDQSTLVQRLMGWVNSFAIALTHVAEAAVSAARFILNAWNGLKFAFAAIMVGIVGGLELANKAIAGMLEQAAKLPVVGGQFAEMAARSRDSANHLEGMRKSFQDQASEALDSAATQNAALDSVRGTIQTVRAAMIAARDAQAAGTAATHDSAAAAAGAAGAQQRLGDAADGAAGSTAKLTKEQDAAKRAAEAHEKKIKDLAESLGGKDTIQKAEEFLAALGRVGALHTLTKAKQEEVLTVMGAAVETYAAMGERAPADIQKVYDALVRLVLLPQMLKESNKAFAAEIQASLATTQATVIASGQALADAIKAGKAAAVDVIDEVFLARLTDTARTIELANRQRDESIRAIEPIRTLMPAIYDAALDAIEARHRESVGKQKTGWDNFIGEAKNALTGGKGLTGAIGNITEWAIPHMDGKMKEVFRIGSAAAKAFSGDATAAIALAQEYIGKFVAWAANKLRGLFGGPDEKEMAGRESAAAFRAQLAGMMNDQQRLEAGNDEWAKSVIVVRDAYIAAGRTEREALDMMEKLWQAEKQGAGAVEAVMKEINAVMEQGRTIAEQAASEQLAQEKALTDAAAKRAAAMQKHLDDLKQKRKSLADSIADEAPEAVMGVIEKRTRAQMAVLDAKIKQQEAKMKAQATTAAKALEDALAKLKPKTVDIPFRWVPTNTPGSSGIEVPTVPMANGGVGRVTRPTLFLAGEKPGGEDFAFSGVGRRFGQSGTASAQRAQVFLDGQEVGYAILPGLTHALRASL